MYRVILILIGIQCLVVNAFSQPICEQALQKYEEEKYEACIPLFDQCIALEKDSSQILLHKLYQLRAYNYSGNKDLYTKGIAVYEHLPDKYFKIKLKALIYKAKDALMVDFNSALDLMIELDSIVVEKGNNQDRLITSTLLAQSYQMIAKNELSYEYHLIALELADKNEKDNYLALLNGISLAGSRIGLDSAVFYIDQGINYIDNYYNKDYNKGDSARVASFYNTVGQFYNNQGKLASAIEFYSKSIALSPDTYYYTLTKLGVIYSLTGLFIDIKENDRAQEYIDLAMPLIKNIKNKTIQGKHLSSISQLIFKMGDHQKADSLALISIELLKKSRYNKDIAQSLIIHAQCEVERGNIYEAGKTLEKIKEIIKNIKDNQLIAQYFELHSDILFAQSKYDQSISESKQLLAHSKQYILPQFEMNAYNQLSNSYLRRRDYQQALFYQDHFHQLKDSIYLSDQGKYIAELDSKYRKAEQALEIIKLSNENIAKSEQISKKNTQLIIGMISIFGLGFITFLIYRLYDIKKTSSLKLQKQNQLIKRALSDRELLLKEIHHRVKNNLQMVSSLLRLQSRYITDESALSAIKEGQNRVNSMTLIHQSLYLEDDFTSVRIEDYFHKLIEVLYDSYKIDEKDINLEIKIEDLLLDVDIIIPLGLITNELVSNAIKYAFPETKVGKIEITFQTKDDFYILEIKDNGKGFNSRIVNEDMQSFGYQMILAFMDRLEGKMDITSNENMGTQIRISIPILLKEGQI